MRSETNPNLSTPEVVIKISGDGSPTLYVPHLDEHYHSVHGAIQESMHVFIRAGLSCAGANPLRILEVGMGTGLNVLLTASHCGSRRIYYHAVEKYPLKPEIYLNLPVEEKSKSLFFDLHNADWNMEFDLLDTFTLLKSSYGCMEAPLSDSYNLVYFDAFAPDKQPDLWTKEVFERLYQVMAPGGLLVTYCAKGIVRRTMQMVGFEVERLPGPPGKRQMLRALKKCTTNLP